VFASALTQALQAPTMPSTIHKEIPMHRWLLMVALAGLTGSAWADAAAAAALQLKQVALAERLQTNAFNRPLVLDSTETSTLVSGEIYAVINHPFQAVSTGLNSPDHWCDVMSLPMNTKYCRAVTQQGSTVLKVNIGKKSAESLIDAQRIVFNYAVAELSPQYLDIRLDAKNGPMGTSNYRIKLEAIPTRDAKTFIHLTYSYSVNFAGRLAIQTYLGTIGRGKVGFTRVGQPNDGSPQFIDGLRGLVERNTMRYYLAIDSFLDATSEPAPAALERRLQTWFSAAELYPRQLHEIERAEYLAMKRDEYKRQQTAD
jgi:hypothetical protein